MSGCPAFAAGHPFFVEPLKDYGAGISVTRTAAVSDIFRAGACAMNEYEPDVATATLKKAESFPSLPVVRVTVVPEASDTLTTMSLCGTPFWSVISTVTVVSNGPPP